jgi:NADPH-dependent ferric siderophore reductase
MAIDRTDLVGQPVPLPEATSWHLEVVQTGPLTPTIRRVVFTAPDLDSLRYVAGQDFMLRVPRADRTSTNRRYTIRAFDSTRSTVTIDVALHAKGPGTDWFRSASAGDQIDAIGPRGKITPRVGAHWHLFIGDETGMPGAFAMMEALPAGTLVRTILEVDSAADELTPALREGQPVQLTWVHRLGRSEAGDASLLRQAITDLDLPSGSGHAYVAAEAGVVRTVQELLKERGLGEEQISAKAYWRRGLPNADHGEPVRN